ncbi:MAG: class I SAM-dependent methyltransferase [Chitinophagaceae bacterium]|nr:class I SAM-dependent methyltransferase [Chitinophagaceae bacterium]
MTDEEKFKIMAAQLRKPSGNEGLATADWMSNLNYHIIQETLKILNAGTNDSILEIGMANGYYVKEILERSETIRYTGLDFSELMVFEARKLNARWIEAGRARFVHGDVNTTKFADDTFDKIFTVNTIYFWEEEKSMLQNLGRILKPGGEFIIAFRPKHQSEKFPFTKYGFKQYSLAEAANLLVVNGFNIIDQIENQEPGFDMDGQILNLENNILVAVKS